MMNPICFAADFPNLDTAAHFMRLHELYDHIGAVKVGLEMFISSGPRAVEVFAKEFAIPVVLDLKLHDIPETIARAVKAGGDLGVKYMTMHIQQRETIEMAVKAAEPYGITLLGVTVLTSMVSSDLSDLDVVLSNGLTSDPAKVAVSRAKFAYGCGLRGFVCSPQEVGVLHKKHSDAFYLVPGIRPAGSEAGDQKRVGTPAKAVKDGANLIVVGRPIRDAENPKEAAKSILNEVESTYFKYV